MLGITSVVIFLTCMLGAAGGIGGGAMYTPILMVILGLTAHQAIPVAKITISGVGIGSYLITARIRHPKADRPIIDYDLANIFEPTVLLGTIVGVYLNVTFPSYIIVILLALTLVVASYKTFKKAMEIYKNEKKLEIQGSLKINETPSSIYNEEIFNSQSSNETLELLLKKDAKTFPLKKIFTILFVFAVLMVIVILKGNQTGKSIIGVTCGTWQFWLILSSAVPFVFLVTFFVSRKLNRRHKEKIAANFQYLPEDIRYTPRVTVRLPIMSFFAGVGAGFFGIGAGMILSPMMIELGVIPQVTAATSAFTVIFTASSTSLQFIILGRLDWQAAVWFWAIGFMASIIGQIGVAYLVKKYKKQSYVNFLIFIAIAASTIALVSVQTLGVVHDIKTHSLPSFEPICSSKGPSAIEKFSQIFMN